MKEAMKLWFKEGYTDFDSSEGLNRNNPFELKRLNIIVGANNSGKSRFMRELACKIYIDEISLKNLTSYLQLLQKVGVLLNMFSVNDEWNTSAFEFNSLNVIKNNYTSNLEKLTQIKDQVNLAIARANYPSQSSHPTAYKIYDLYRRQSYNDNSYSKLFDELQNIIEELVSLEEEYKLINVSVLKIFYINSLRSLKNFVPLNSLDNLEIEKIISYKNEILIRKSTISPDGEEHTHVTKKEILDKLRKNTLLLRVYKDYDFLDHQIVTGEDFFEFLTDSLLGMPEERQRIDDYQAKLSHYFFNNEVITLIPHRKDDSLHIKIGEAEQFPISQLGDGLQQVIILTYKAFLTTEPSFFFIEEPEMHLHAGYVKQIMKFLLNETDHYYMATSHSNYLLDMINEDKRIALYRIDKENVGDEENKYETVIRRCDGDRTILQTLGVSPSSVFLANCTIWIEGITDRLYFVQYLKKYLEELKITDQEKWENYSRFIDGYHYAFVEYQGSNLEHWDFEVDSLEDVDSGKNKGLNAVLVTSNALVIADSDLKKKPRFNELEQQLGDKIAITQGKETENSLPRKFLVKKFFEMCPDNGLAKQRNKKKLAYSDEYEKYFTDSYQISPKGIGKYFDTALNKMRRDGIVPQLETDETSFSFSDGNQGTIKSKTNFCQDIVELMQSEPWELTPSATELCESIFQHIKDNNH